MAHFMIHPAHGAAHIEAAQIAEHEKAGWKRSTYEEWLSTKPSLAADVAALLAGAPASATAKKGK